MSLTLIIIINAALDVAIVSALAFVMSRATRLERHMHFVPAAAAPPARHPAPRPRAARHGPSAGRAGAAFQ
jgi:hypothetical protein